jgi:hypothetical protein
MESRPLFQLVYSSVATPPFPPDELTQLLLRARQSNRLLGVTGLLLHGDGQFLQVIEGHAGAVLTLYDKISRDPRHDHIQVHAADVIAERSFGDWTMGFADVVRADVPGLVDFLQTGFRDTGYTPALAKKVRDAALQFRFDHMRKHVSAA